MGLMPYVRPTFDDANSILATGHQLFFYIAGTTTKQDTFTDSSLAVANPNPIILNARGEPGNAGTPIDVYFTPGLSYKVVYTTDTDTDPPTTPIWTVDNVTDTGGAGSGASGQWLTGITAVYVSGTTFNITGIDVTADFHKGRKVWLSGGNNRYATIFASSFAGDTTVSLVDIQDSTGAAAVLDPVMTTVSLSIQRVDADRAIHYRFYPGTEAGVTNYEFPIGDLRRYGAKMDGVDDNTAYTNCIAAITAGGTLFVPDGIAVIQPDTITKKIHFIGVGTLKMAANSDADFITFGVGSDGSTMRDITIDVNNAGQTIEGIGATVTVGDVDIFDTHIQNGSEGIQVTSANAVNTQIQSNHFEGNTLANVSVRVDASGASIQNNIMSGATHGIRVLQASDVIISGNNITGFTTEGIEVAKVTTIAFDVIITDNYISNQAVVSTGTGIAVKTSDNTIISNNILDKIEDNAITVDRLTGGDPASNGTNVTNNIIIEPVDTGIHIGSTDETLITNNNLITNNVSLRGIYVLGVGVGGATKAIVSNNRIGACVTSELSTPGADVTSLVAENLLSTGPERFDHVTFNGSSLGLVNVNRLSTTTTASKNFHGLATWPGGTNNSNAVVFGASEPDTNYEIILSEGLTQWSGGFHCYITSKTTTGFTVTTISSFPTAGKQRAWFLIRIPTAATS